MRPYPERPVLLSLALGLALAATPDLRDAEWHRDVDRLALFAKSDAPGVRAEAARALGRTREEKALDPLAALARDPDLAVRREALAALAWVPGGDEPLREALQVLPRHSGWGKAEAAAELRGVAMWALGHHGSDENLALLVEGLRERGPAAVGAATGLGRMGRDKVEGVEAALSPLLAAAERDLGELPEAAAYAAGRIGCDEPNAPRAARRAATSPWPTARAYLLRCAGKGLDAKARAEAARAGLADDDAFVRVTALGLLEEGDPVVLAVDAVEDADPGVRTAAVAALGRLGARRQLEMLAADPDPWRAAEAIDALLGIGVPAEPAWVDGPLPVQVAVAGHAPLESAVELALTAKEPAVRSAACGALLGAELAPEQAEEVGRRLLGASDGVVRAVGVGLLEGVDPEAQKALLLPVIRVETDPEVLGEALGRLAGFEWKQAPEGVDVSLRRAMGLGHDRVARKAAALAAAMDVEAPDAAADPRLLIDLERTATLRSVVVETSRGSFTIELFPEVAPLAAHHFATRASEGFYDEAVFHRVVPSFVAQTGCPRGDGWGGPGYTLPDEVSDLAYVEGRVGIARSDRDTGGSQWFVTTSDQPHLTGDYTLIGEVSHGMHVVHSLRRGDVVHDVRVEVAP